MKDRLRRFRPDRRAVLRGLGASLALPWLDALPRLAASPKPGPFRGPGAATPTRAAWLYYPNGSPEGSFDLAKVGRDGQLIDLGQDLAPLQRVREHLLIPTKLRTPEGNGHGAGTATWLTGHDFDGRTIDVFSPSVDQIAARSLRSQTLLPSLQLSTVGEGYFAKDLPRNAISWESARQPAFRDKDPRTVFDRMFRPGGGDRRDRDLLDLVLEDAKDLRRSLGPADQAKLDEYLESIRSVERRLAFAEARAAAGEQATVDLDQRPPASLPDDHGKAVELLLDLVVLAFQSDATRVSTVMLDHGQSNRYFDFVPGVKGTWHALSHWRDTSGKTEDDDGKTSWTSRSEKRGMYAKVVAWHHEQVARLIERLAAIPEGDGSLLDHCALCYGSNLGDGHEHEELNLPTVLAGKAGGRWRPGRQIANRRWTDLAEIHLSMLRSLGVEAESFGEAEREMRGLR